MARKLLTLPPTTEGAIQKELRYLYQRKSALDDLIRSLEAYDRSRLRISLKRQKIA